MTLSWLHLIIYIEFYVIYRIKPQPFDPNIQRKYIQQNKCISMNELFFSALVGILPFDIVSALSIPGFLLSIIDVKEV